VKSGRPAAAALPGLVCNSATITPLLAGEPTPACLGSIHFWRLSIGPARIPSGRLTGAKAAS
jgi:hypothetical protein